MIVGDPPVIDFPPARLDLAIASDGSARIDGDMPFPSGHGFILLEAEPDTAHCACADADGNGRSGLTRVEFQARDPRGGELVPVILVPAAEREDIDRAGRYALDVRVGDARATLVADVRSLPGRHRRRHRRRRRNRRR